MDDIKILAKNEKDQEILKQNHKNIQPGYRNGILHWKLCHAENEKVEKSNEGSNRTESVNTKIVK